MATSRPTPQQVLTDLPLEAAREATWQGFKDAGVKSPVIDGEQSLVVGTTGDGVLMAARSVRATFSAEMGGTLISLESNPIMGGVIESKKVKLKLAAKIADAVEGVIARGWQRRPVAHEMSAVAPAMPTMPAPIAAPGAPVAAMSGDPLYGQVLPHKQGTTLIIYGVLSLFCCQILAPFTIYYSTKALKTYGDVDPGDKNLVVIARILGIIGCLFLVGRIALLVIGNNQ